MTDLSQQLLARRAREAAAQHQALADATAIYWAAAFAAATIGTTEAPTIDQLDEALQTLQRQPDDLAKIIRQLRDLAELRTLPTPAEAQVAYRAEKDAITKLDEEAVDLRKRADALEAAARQRGLAARDDLDAAKRTARELAAASERLRSQGCPEFDLLVPLPPPELVRRVKTDCECIDQDGRRHRPGEVFDWHGAGGLPPHLVEVDERGAPIAKPVPAEAPAPRAVAAAVPTLTPEFFAVEGGAS